MADIATITTSSGEGDWAVAGAQLQQGDDLATSVLISFFTDAQANLDDTLPDASGDRRGWWGNPQMGSRLWLLARAKQTQDTLSLAEEYATEALAWMLNDGVALSVAVKAFWRAPSFLVLVVKIKRTDGSTPVLAYAWAWDTSGVALQLPAVNGDGQLDYSDPNNSALFEVV